VVSDARPEADQLAVEEDRIKQEHVQQVLAAIIGMVVDEEVVLAQRFRREELEAWLNPTSELLGVLRTLVTMISPSSNATRSVKVPPTSTPTRIDFCPVVPLSPQIFSLQAAAPQSLLLDRPVDFCTHSGSW
jgi:hypothetical protein